MTTTQAGCPKCSSQTLRYMEPVWTDRRLSHVAEDGTLIFDGQADVNWEADESNMAIIHCDHCEWEWKPATGTLDFN